ncbi:MAG: hypothetical protein GC168_12885 [Candidatus Hydrogenedens sp.]|nr:hypothetical protein [Candidatus Hydrogenedens sp.]
MAAALAVVMLAGSVAAEPPLTISFWAVRASHAPGEEQHFDAGLSEVVESLADLPFNDFQLVSSGDLTAEFGGGRAERELTDRYHFFFEPQSREAEGRARARLCVEMRDVQDKNRMVKAVDSRVVLAPGQPMRMGGLKLDGGDLILIIKMRS